MTAGIRWLSIGPGSGYGDASEAYLSGLRAAGVPVSWTPLGWGPNRWGAAPGPLDGRDHGLAHRDIANVAIDHDTVVVASTPIWHAQLADEVSARRLVAFTTWETDRLPPEWVEILDRYDRVLVPSRFNRDTFVASGLRPPVQVVPHIARPVEKSAHAVGQGIGAGTFTFYVIATWTTRKAILDTVAAYVAAFDDVDDVVLVIHTTAEDHVARERFVRGERPWRVKGDATWFSLATALAGRAHVPKIVLSTRPLDRAGIDALHARGDCCVSLSRGEGWGLSAFDAGGHGNPVVVTGWGGTLDFLPPDYPYCADFDLVPADSEEPDSWLNPRLGGRWAKVRIAHAAALLRRVFEHREEARHWGSALRSNIGSSFESAQVTRRLLDTLEGIPGQGGQPP